MSDDPTRDDTSTAEVLNSTAFQNTAPELGPAAILLWPLTAAMAWGAKKVKQLVRR